MGIVNLFKGLDLQKEIYNFNGSIREHLDLNWEYTKIYKGSQELTPDYQVQDDDIIIVQELPGFSTTAMLIFAGISIAIGIGTGIYSGIQAKKTKKDMENALGRIGKDNNKKQNELSSIPWLSGAKNERVNGKNAPIIIGKHLFTPYFLSDPYLRPSSTNDGKDLYWYGTFIAGQNGLCFENKRINENNPSGIRNGLNELVTNFTTNAKGVNFNDNEAQYGKFYFDKPDDFYTKPNRYNPDHIDYNPPPFWDAENFVEIVQGNHSFSESPYFDDKWVDSLDSTVELERIKKEGAEVVKENFSGNREEEFIDDQGPDEIIRETARFPLMAEIEISVDGLHGWDSENEKETPATVGVKIEWSADGKTWPNAPLKINNWTYITAGSTYLHTNFLERKKSSQMRFLATVTFTPDVFSEGGEPVFIRATRVTKMHSGGYRDRVYLSAIRTKQYNPRKSSNEELIAAKNINERFVPGLLANKNKFCRIGIKIKVNKNTQASLDKFNIVASMTARTWTGIRWSPEKTKTSNPAAVALEILTGLIHDPSKYNYDELNLTSSEINLKSFGDLYKYCQDRKIAIAEKGTSTFNIEANGVVTNATKKLDVLKSVLAVCDAGLYMDEFGKFNVYYDDYQSTPIALLNPQRIVKINESRALERKMDGYTVEFIDQKADWSTNTYRILRPRVEENPGLNTYTSVKLDYTTGYYQAMWHVRRMMAKEIHRPGQLKITVGKEGRLYRPGSLIKVQHEGLKIGLGSGEITEILRSEDGEYITGFKMMEKLYIADDKDYFIEYFVVKDNAEPHVVDSTYGKTMRLISVGKYTDTFMLSTHIPASDFYTPDIGNITSVLYSPRLHGSVYESSRYVVSELSENDDGYDLTLFPYKKDIYNETEFDIPPYQTLILNAAPNGYSHYEPMSIDGGPGQGIITIENINHIVTPIVKNNAPPAYKGAVTTPKTNGDGMNPGDYVMYIGNDSPPTWLYGYIIRWTGTVWERLDRPSQNPKNGWMYLDGISDLTRGAKSDVFSDVFTESIVANRAFINELSTKQITMKDGGSIQSANWDGYEHGWAITGNEGYATFFDIYARGTIQSDVFNATKGWKIDANGDAIFRNGTFSGKLVAATGDFTGKVTATSGTFGGSLTAASVNITGVHEAGDKYIISSDNRTVKTYDTEAQYDNNELIPIKTIKVAGKGTCKIKVASQTGNTKCAIYVNDNKQSKLDISGSSNYYTVTLNKEVNHIRLFIFLSSGSSSPGGYANSTTFQAMCKDDPGLFKYMS